MRRSGSPGTPVEISTLALAAFVAASIGACTTTLTLGSGEPRVYPDGAPRIQCGPLDCDQGKICCNAVCGICAAPGGCGTSPSMTCSDAGTTCDADRVSLTGDLVCSHFVWNGVDCTEILGCTCTGDCTLPETSYVACMQRHAACWSSACSPSAFCPTGFYCRRDGCDTGSRTGTCTPTPTDCSTSTSSATCGCDGITYRSPCEAARAGQSVSSAPTCGTCNAPDVTITTGGCSRSLGWSWSTTSCVERIGCTCSGACDALEPTESACLTRYAACADVYPCGSTSCRRRAEVCQHGAMDDACSTQPVCAIPSCECLVSAGITSVDRCTEDGLGAVVITTP